MTDPPKSIRAHQADQILEIGWPDGRLDRLGYRLLRGACPCASCRDEWTGRVILDPATIAEDIKLAGMEHVGSYAVQFAWSDGHSSGIYTWQALRHLGETGEPAPRD
jgi:DUF971 family protein